MANEKLTIAMLTYEDYHGVYFTISSIRLHHPEVAGRIRFLVVDNSPDGPHGKEVAKFCSGKNDVDYQQVRHVSSSTFKNLCFELAQTPYVLHLDCHVLLAPGSINKLLKFYEHYPECCDLLQGPLLSDEGTVLATHMEPVWRGGNFGIWAKDDRGTCPGNDMFEIPLHGMGLFSCSRAAWPRFASGMTAFGAEEGSIHEKFRLLGRKTYCLPFLQWMHRFGRPGGAQYRNTQDDKVRNYITSFKEVGLPLQTIQDHFMQHVYKNESDAARKWISELMTYQHMLPPCPFKIPADYKPFLGFPIKDLKG
jgi:hypothetical protein